MPKLDPTHIAERLQHRIKQLEAGEEVAVKEINSLLTVGQRKAFDDAWQAQSKLRKKKRARNEAEQKALGWKTKREVRLEVLRQALEEVSGNMLKSLRELQQKAEIRGARIFLDNYFNAMEQKKTEDEALTRANNALRRAHLQPMFPFRAQSVLSQRDREVRAMEEMLRERFLREAEDEGAAENGKSAKLGKKRVKAKNR